jgi:hypothetical protein
MRGIFIFAIFVGLVGSGDRWGLKLVAACQIGADNQTTDEDIRQWTKDLGADGFKRREAATRNLMKAGKKGLDHVAKTVEGRNQEAAVRALDILRQLAKTKESETAEAARKALVKLAGSTHRITARRAQGALRDIQLQIAQQLEQLGGSFQMNSDRIVAVNLDAVVNLGAALPLLRNLPDLEHVSLSNPVMNDDFMAELKGLSKLQDLNLYSSNIGDNSLQVMKSFPNLRRLPMGQTKVTDAGLVHLKGLKQLEYVGLRANKITDAGLAQLRHLTNLTGLYLGETKVTDAGLVHLKGMKKMTWLRLGHTKVTDIGLSHLMSMTKLEALDLSHTNVSQAGIFGLRMAIPKLQITTERPQ